MGFLPPIILELRAKAGEFKTEMAESRAELKKVGDEAEHTSGRMQKGFHTAAAAGKVMAVGIVGVGLAVGGFAVEAATAAQNAESNLDNALKKAGSSADAMRGQIDSADGSMRKFGYTNQDTNQALANMTVALGDPKKALADLGLASDIARLKNISLAQAGLLVAKASEGQTKGLKALGIDLPVAAGGAKAVAAAQAQLALVTAKASTFLKGHSDAVQAGSKYHLTYMQMLDKVHAAQAKVNATQSAGGTILAALRAKVGGTAAAYGETLSGKIAAAHAQLESLAETLGNKLIPWITKAIGWGTKFAMMLVNNKPAMIAIGVVLGTVVVGAIGAYIASLVMAAATSARSFGQMIAKVYTWAAANAASVGETVALYAMYAAETVANMARAAAAWVAQTVATGAAATAAGVMTAAQWLLNAAMSANPITLVVIAIVALIAIFVLAYNKIGWFRAGVQAVFHAVGAIIKGTVDFIKSHWQLLLAILTGPVGLAILWVKNNWAKVTGFFTVVKAGIKTALADLGDIILWPFKTAFNMVATLWDNTIGKIGFTVPSWVPVIGGKGFHFPQIPHMATGGIVKARPGGTIVALGDGGQDEVVSQVGAARGGGGGAVHLHVHFDGPIMGTPREARMLAQALFPHLQQYVLRQQQNAGYNPFSGVAVART